jgi:hypothetical protein
VGATGDIVAVGLFIVTFLLVSKAADWFGTW